MINDNPAVVSPRSVSHGAEPPRYPGRGGREVEAPDRRDSRSARPEAICSRLVPKAAGGKAGHAGDDVAGWGTIGSASRAARRRRTAERRHFWRAFHGKQGVARQV